MSDTQIFFTDRSPLDDDPLSFWLWESLKDRARSGSDVFIYRMDKSSENESFIEGFPSRLHLRSGLQSSSVFSWGPLIQSVIEANPSSICLVEPKQSQFNIWPLLMLPNLRTLKVINAQISALIFSQSLNSFPWSTWVKASDLVMTTHPYFVRSKSALRSQRFETVMLDPKIFSERPHWSFSNPSPIEVLPGSLGELIDPKGFLENVQEIVTLDPDRKFLFLSGLGKCSREVKDSFLTGVLARHFLFPEDLSAEQKGYILFHSSRLSTESISPQSSLAGLAIKINLEKHQNSLEEKRVYGLL